MKEDHSVACDPWPVSRQEGQLQLLRPQPVCRVLQRLSPQWAHGCFQRHSLCSRREGAVADRLITLSKGSKSLPAPHGAATHLVLCGPVSALIWQVQLTGLWHLTPSAVLDWVCSETAAELLNGGVAAVSRCICVIVAGGLSRLQVLSGPPVVRSMHPAR